MNTLWIYSKAEPKLCERLTGMEFDRAILSEAAQQDMGIHACVLSRVRDTNTNGGTMTTSKPCAAWDLGHTCEVFENELCGKVACLLSRKAS